LQKAKSKNIRFTKMLDLRNAKSKMFVILRLSLSVSLIFLDLGFHKSNIL